MTGRAAGFCAGYGVPGYANPGFGRGMGMGCGRGRGRGWRNMFYATGLTGWQRADALSCAPPSGEQELETLKAQAGTLESALGGIRRRIENLEARKA